MATNNALVTKAMLVYYDGKIKNWVQLEISDKISALGDVFTIKGKVATVDALPAADNKAGDLYLVASEGASESAEYYWTGEKWEYMGVTGVSLDGYVNETQLYKGVDGTGTVDAPAAGTILAPIYSKIAEIEAAVEANTQAIADINNVSTGILAQSKTYTDDSVNKAMFGEGGTDDAPVAGSVDARLEALEVITSDVITTADIDALFTT